MKTFIGLTLSVIGGGLVGYGTAKSDIISSATGIALVHIAASILTYRSLENE